MQSKAVSRLNIRVYGVSSALPAYCPGTEIEHKT